MTRWDDLDTEAKAKIDAMSREDMENHLREEDPTSELRQGLAGEYFEERYKAASGGLTTDDFNNQMAADREMEDAEAEDDAELGETEEEDGEDDDTEGEEEPVTA